MSDAITNSEALKEESQKKESQKNNNYPLGFVGVITVLFALAYCVWASTMAYSINGRVFLDATTLLCKDLGLDMTDVNQIELALQHSDLQEYIKYTRDTTHANWFLMRHLSMSVLSLLVVISLYKCWPSNKNYIVALAISIPASMIALVLASPTLTQGGIGMILNSTVAGIFWIVLWFLNMHRFKKNKSKNI